MYMYIYVYFILFCFMSYQQLLVIQCQSILIHIYQIYMICNHILLITFLTNLCKFFFP